MRIAVTGATGNVGTGLLRRLMELEPHPEVVGICRRPPEPSAPYDIATWHAIDVAASSAPQELAGAFDGADAVVHSAWAIQPVRRPQELQQINVRGTRAVLEAVEAAGVPHLVQVSSLAVYTPGQPGPVGEDELDTGVPSSAYSQDKVVVERLLDRFEAHHPDVTVTRLRPTLVAQRDAAARLSELFLEPLVPSVLFRALRTGVLPILPLPTGVQLQIVHADDLGDAFVRVLQQHAAGVFNIAADTLDAHDIAAVVGARAVGVPDWLVRGLIRVLWRCRLIGASPGWYDVGTKTPPMDTTRAREDLGWVPAVTSAAAAHELLDGLADAAQGSSPVLSRCAPHPTPTPAGLERTRRHPQMTSSTAQTDLITVLTNEHRDVERIFDRLEALSGGTSEEAATLAHQVVTTLVQHSVAEEIHLYPTVRAKLDDGDTLADHEVAEHDDAEQTMRRLEALRPGDENFWAAVHELMREIRQHVHEEETELFPRLQQACSADELRDLGQRVERAEAIAPTRPHPVSPSEGGALAALAPGAGLVDRLRDVLSGRRR